MEKKREYVILSEEEKQKLRQLSQISLWLDSYDDLFSDFDPRQYSQRALSVDFLKEAERAMTEKKRGVVEFNLLVPSQKRETGKESTIKKRLKEHFKRDFEHFRKEVNSLITKGLILAVCGVLFMFLATYIAFVVEDGTLLTTFLIVLLEPAGWFLFWSGMDTTLFHPKKYREKLEFYRKMSNSIISFMPY